MSSPEAVSLIATWYSGPAAGSCFDHNDKNFPLPQLKGFHKFALTGDTVTVQTKSYWQARRNWFYGLGSS